MDACARTYMRAYRALLLSPPNPSTPRYAFVHNRHCSASVPQGDLYMGYRFSLICIIRDWGPRRGRSRAGFGVLSNTPIIAAYELP